MGSRGYMESIINVELKETAVSEVKSESVHGETAGPLVLLDCGQASQVTKGVPFMVLYELGWPPFDRLLY